MRLVRALDSHPEGMTRNEAIRLFKEAGFDGSVAYTTCFKAVQSLVDQGVVEYSHREQMLRSTGKGLTMVEIIDGKEVKVVY